MAIRAPDGANKGREGIKCLDLAEMIIIARASEVPVPSEGLSVSLMHFPSLFLKNIITVLNLYNK